MTQFIGIVQPSKAPFHSHPYEELGYIVEGEGFEALTTHIFDPDDPYIDTDAVFGVKQSLLAEFRKVEDAEAAAEAKVAAPFYDVEFDFVLSRT